MYIFVGKKGTYAIYWYDWTMNGIETNSEKKTTEKCWIEEGKDMKN